MLPAIVRHFMSAGENYLAMASNPEEYDAKASDVPEYAARGHAFIDFCVQLRRDEPINLSRDDRERIFQELAEVEVSDAYRPGDWPAGEQRQAAEDNARQLAEAFNLLAQYS
jgi:hypothetical protein